LKEEEREESRKIDLETKLQGASGTGSPNLDFYI
jgi:hypothetical protein